MTNGNHLVELSRRVCDSYVKDGRHDGLGPWRAPLSLAGESKVRLSQW